MSNPVCQACGSTDVAVRMGKNGKPYLIDTRRPHFCPKRPKNGAKPKKAKLPAASPERELAVAGLMALQYKVTEAKEMLKDIPEGKPNHMVLAALRKKGADE